jgi:predicted transcriptional regulator
MPGSAAEKTFDALGNPIRRKILRILNAQPHSVGEIAGALPVSRPAVSKHLRILEKADLVSHEKRGSRNVFTLNGKGVRSAQAYVTAFLKSEDSVLP